MSDEKGLLQQWPADGPALAWKTMGLGGGDSAPSVAKGHIFGMGNISDEEVVWALSEPNGERLWVTPLGSTFQQRMPQSKEGPGCTPAVDGDRVYALTMGGQLACLRVTDGKILWQKSLVDDFGGRVPTWSYRESPLVDGERLICTPGAADATLVALNKMTGELIWKSPPPAAPAGAPRAGKVDEAAGGREGAGGRDGARTSQGRRGGFGRGRGGFGRGPSSGAAYSSVIAIDFEGQRQYVQLTGSALVGVAAADGKPLWRYERPANRTGINCSTPLYHDGFVFASSAYGAGGGLAKLTKDETGNIKAEEVWFNSRLQNHHGGVILFEGCLYGANGGNEGGALICLDFKTGEVLWDQRSERRAPKGSVAFADGRLYYRTESGPVLLIEPNREQYVERGRFEQPERSEAPAWSHPVIANGKLYIRDQDVLLSYDIKAK
jgi:outer membrane protein assembly factor BamB